MLLYYAVVVTIGLIVAIIGWHKNYQVRLEYGAKIDMADKRLEDSATSKRTIKRLKDQNELYETRMNQLVEFLDKSNTERDEARQIAEKFREKYLVLKQKEDAVRLRAQLEMDNYNKNKELNSGWK